MRDPHVVSVTYDLRPASDTLTFDNPPPIQKANDEFTMKLADNIVTFEMKAHFASRDEAQAAVSNFLRSWEIHSQLKGNGVSFAYKDYEIIDRTPPLPGEPQVIYAESVQMTISVGSVRGLITSRTYPEPPSDFKVNPTVETLWNRYSESLEGKEPLQSMGYFCLSVIEGRGKDRRRRAAEKHNIDFGVLRKLGELTSEERGDPSTARKYGPEAKALTDREKQFQQLDRFLD